MNQRHVDEFNMLFLSRPSQARSHNEKLTLYHDAEPGRRRKVGSEEEVKTRRQRVGEKVDATHESESSLSIPCNDL